MDNINTFRQKAIEAGYRPHEVDLFLLTKASQAKRLQGMQTQDVSLIPNATGGDVSLIPNGNGGQILPAKFPITQAFGNYNPAIEKYSGGVNYGVDIGAPEGTDVSLPQGAWKVLEAIKGNFNRGYGNSILVQNAQTGEKLRFSHLSQLANLKSGQTLPGGVRIAKTGATGNVTGPHLDLEYYNKLNQLANVLNSPYGRKL